MQEWMTYEMPRNPAMPWLAVADFIDAEDRQYLRDWVAGRCKVQSIADIAAVPTPRSADKATS